jgi:hypothetical protein
MNLCLHGFQLNASRVDHVHAIRNQGLASGDADEALLQAVEVTLD